MPISAVDNIGEITLDSVSYWIKPDTYHMHQPRVRKATIRADNGEAYVDLGAGKRVWSFVVLCYNDLTSLDGNSLNTTGEQYREDLQYSYQTSSVGTTIVFVDPTGNSINVHFDDYKEYIPDLRSQQVAVATGASIGLSYEVAVVLVEA